MKDERAFYQEVMRSARRKEALAGAVLYPGAARGGWWLRLSAALVAGGAALLYPLGAAADTLSRAVLAFV